MSRVIDADGHVAEPSIVWEQYTEPEFRDRVIQIRPNPAAPDDLWIDGVNLTSGALNVAATCIPGGLADAEISRRARWQDVPRAASDPRARLDLMDQEGIDVAVLYPTLWLLYGDIRDPRVAAATCRAYNDWIADFCRTDPRRLFAVAPMPIQSVDEAVREMRRVVTELGFKAVFVRPNPFNDRRLSDPAYDPFWREAQELGIPVAVHSSFGTRMPTLGGDRYRKNPFFFHMVCHTFELMAAAMDVVCGGVLAKFPRLRVGFLESGVGWLGYWLDRMDGHFEKMGPYVPWLKKKPSEYFLEQCFLSLDPDERTVAAMVDLGAQHTILWGSDYPHFDCTFPGLIREVEHACAKLSEPAKKSIREENAARFYGLSPVD